MKKKIIFLGIILCFCFMIGLWGIQNHQIIKTYEDKISLMKSQLELYEDEELQVVFISICNTKERANVFKGTGNTFESAFNEANKNAKEFIKENKYNSEWIKIDLVTQRRNINYKELSKEIYSSRHEFYRYGLSFDSDFNLALLETELNGAKIYEYDNGGIDLEYLNLYLKKAERNTDMIAELPTEYILFETNGVFCDENYKVYKLSNTGYNTGRRQIEILDDTYAKELVQNSTEFLQNQINEDGSFIYGMYPRFDNELENYNIVRHTSTIWSLICSYRIEPNEQLKKDIENTIKYMLNEVVYTDENTAYLYEKDLDEIKLGGCALAVIALTEYMDAFQNTKYMDVCNALGNGILTMFDETTGKYFHTLNGDFSRKDEFRTVYYDGEATFALSRLYGLTKEQKWLDMAEVAVNYFIEENYEQYKDHWIAYSLNEITKYVDKEEYYAFALKNAQENLQIIYDRDTTWHTYSELLMATFEVYDRMKERNITVEYEKEFDLDFFLDTIYYRLNHMLNGYFFPEYAMYMRNPKRILNSFFVRHDGFRVRIDDVQHNIDGYYQYYKNYEKLIQYGMQFNYK